MSETHLTEDALHKPEYSRLVEIDRRNDEDRIIDSMKQNRSFHSIVESDITQNQSYQKLSSYHKGYPIEIFSIIKVSKITKMNQSKERSRYENAIF